MFEKLAEMEYPGRVIIVGQNNDGLAVALYAITGRSESSQARRLVMSEDQKGIIVQPTDKELLKKGDPDLLVYPAIVLKGAHIVISNGKQTESLADVISQGVNLKDMTYSGLKAKGWNWKYEPDKPNYTPRINGCIYKDEAILFTLFHCKDGSVGTGLDLFDFEKGKGKILSTYTGENKDPLPSFTRLPIEVGLNFDTIKDTVEAMYDTLSPNGSNPDFRVSVAGVSYKHGEPHFREVYIKNRHDS